MTDQDPIILVKDLYKYFDDIKAVDGVSLSIEKGIPDLAGLRLGVDVVKTLTACDAALTEATAQ